MPAIKKQPISARFVGFLERVNSTSVVGMLTQINFLAYYFMLGVYAIINVMQLAKPFVGLWGQIAIAGTLASCAILNEFIDMSVVVEKKTHDEYADDQAKQKAIVRKNKSRLSWYLVSAVTACALGVCHFGLTTYNMVWLQLTTIKLSPWLSSVYFGVFVSSAVLGALLTYTNSYLKYIRHVLLPGTAPNQDAPKEVKVVQNKNTHKKPAELSSTSKNIFVRSAKILGEGVQSFAKSVGYGLNAAVNSYLSNSVLMATGTAIGALLYALGDFSQMYGLLFYVAIKNIFVLSPSWQLTVSLVFALNSIFERSGIWGYNFKKYVSEQAHNNKSLEQGYQNNAFAKVIIFDWTTRSVLTNIRLGCVFLLNIFGALLHFKGVYRFAGVATSMGYYYSQGTQNYFQTRKDAASPKAAVDFEKPGQGIVGTQFEDQEGSNITVDLEAAETRQKYS